MSEETKAEDTRAEEAKAEEAPTGQAQPGEKRPVDESWREVGKQFQTLGESLAAAFRTTSQDPDTQRHLQNMKGGLEAMVKEVGQAISEAGASPCGQEVRRTAGEAARTARAATEQAMTEARPQLISALQQINAELQNLIARLDRKDPPPAAGA
jgi:hypothetical protein